MEKRIVLICNFSEYPGRGVLKTLGGSRSHPFVNTYLFDEKNSPRITQSTPYLYLRRDLISTNPVDDWQVLLITDALDTNDYPKDIFNSDTLVMYHTEPSNVAEYLDQYNIYSKKQGQHEPGEKHGYQLINYLVGAYDETQRNFEESKYDEAINRLIDWFAIDYVLEAKLNLLHKCLDPQNVPDSLEKLIAEEYGAAFRKFRSEMTGETWCSKGYIDALTELRRSLLGS